MKKCKSKCVSKNSESKKDIRKEILLTILLLALMLIPGIILDGIYWKCQLDIVNCSESMPNYVTVYNNAFIILNSNVGVLMTMVSIFLTMNINMAERSEKKVYGIPRKELYMSKKGLVYQGIGRISYIAPILMVVFLNLSYCISGYLLYLYCYSFLIVHYCIHESSYSKSRNQKAVIAKLEGCFPDTGELNADVILQFQMLLENIAKSVEEDGNWQEIGDLYNKLIQVIPKDDVIKAYVISYNFYNIVYWRENNRRRTVSMQLLESYIKAMDASETEAGSALIDVEWSVLWGMLRVAIYKSEESELVEFFCWLFNFPMRSEKVFQKTQKKQSPILLKEQVGMILVLMEYRLRHRSLESQRLKEQIKVAWEYGREALWDEEYNFYAIIQLINEGVKEDDAADIEEIVKDLRNDYRNRKRNSIISNIILV